MTGQQFGRLTFVRFAGQCSDGSAQWLLKCDCGNEIVARRKNVAYGRTASCGCLMSEKARQNARKRRTATPGYTGMHDRLRADRGPASSHPCLDCGGVAQDWSLRRGVQGILSAPDNHHGNPRYWSTNIEDYDPRCRPCHGRYDANEEQK
jgi:hypothetical protein